MMTLTTKRLTLEHVTSADVDDIHTLHSLPETDEYNTLGIPESRAVTASLVAKWLDAQLAGSAMIFRIQLARDKKFIGLIALQLNSVQFRSAEVWYKLHKDFWRNGYAIEALQKLLSLAFEEIRLHRVEAGCAVDNLPSYKVLEKAGFRCEGLKRQNLPIRGSWVDNYFYAILESEYFAMKHAV